MSTCSDGLASVYSALRAGCVPHVCRRASSSPARLVQNDVWPMSSFGTPFSSTSASTPASRRTSIVRWLVMCARGVFAVQRYFVMHDVVDAQRAQEQRAGTAGRTAPDDEDVRLQDAHLLSSSDASTKS